MINQYEVPALIEDALPELKKPLHQFPAIFHIYETVQCLDTYLLRQLRNKNYTLLEKCLQLTGRLYEKGNPLVRNAILRIIVPDLSKVHPEDNLSAIRLYSLIPPCIYNLYMQQHLHLNNSNGQ